MESAIDRTKQDVRNYAKRQMSWFRHKEQVIWLQGFGGEAETQESLFDQLNAKDEAAVGDVKL